MTEDVRVTLTSGDDAVTGVIVSPAGDARVTLTDLDDGITAEHEGFAVSLFSGDRGPAGPTGPPGPNTGVPGPAGPAGPAGDTETQQFMTFIFPSALPVWSCQHDFGQLFVDVVALDINNDEMIGDIEYVSPTLTEIHWYYATAGTACIST